MSYSISTNHVAIKKAIRTTAMFGFLSRSIFDDQISYGNRVYRWALWKKLLSLGLFDFHRDNYLKGEIIKFSSKGLQKLAAINEFSKLQTVPAPRMQNISHDEVVMRFYLHNEKEQLISGSITEAYFKKHKLTDYNLSDDKKNKYPDLVFTLNVPNLKIRIALEIERTRKTYRRYQSFVSAYANLPDIDFVIVACDTPGTKRAISEAITLTRYPHKIRPIAFCDLKELVKNPSDFALDINGKITTLRNRVLALTAQQGGIV